MKMSIVSEFEIFIQNSILSRISKGLRATKNISISVEELYELLGEGKSSPVAQRCKYVFTRKGSKHSAGDRCDKLCDEGSQFCKEHRKRQEAKEQKASTPEKESDGNSDN